MQLNSNYKPEALFAASLFCIALHAQGQTSDNQQIERIVTTATRAVAQQDELPIAISRLSRQDLQLNAHTHIQESLAQVAGVNFHRGNGQETLPALRSPVFTGAGACGELLIAEDSIPVRAAGFCNINELFETHSENAQRIEILKGSGSVFYGANAIHGVINVITPDPSVSPAYLNYDFGSYGYNRLNLKAGKDWGDSGFGLISSITRDSGYRDDESVDQEKITLRYRMERVNWQNTSGFTYTHLDQQTAGFIVGFEAFKDADLAQTNLNPEAFRKNRSIRAWSRNEWNLGHGKKWVITPYIRDQNMDFLQHFLPGKPLETNAQKGAGIQTSWLAAIAPQWQLSLGMDAEYTQGELQQTQFAPTQGSPFLVATVPQGKHYDYAVDATQLAPFANLRWQAKDWIVDVGARYERIEYDYTNNMLTGRTRDDGSECGFGGCRYSRPASSKNSFTNLSPKLGIVYQLNAKQQIFANAGKGFRAPQATELYRLQRAQTIADLDSVEVSNAEIGMRGFGQDWRYLISAYVMQKDNVIFRDSDFFNVNNGETRHQGIELELNYRFTDQWQLDVALSHAKHTYVNDRVLNGININGNYIDTAPQNLANTRLTYSPTDSLQMHVEWHYVDEYYTDPENLHRYDGHSLLNWRGRWQITGQTTLSARVINLTDKRYAERADFTGFSGDRYFPGKPRTFFVGFQYTWQ